MCLTLANAAAVIDHPDPNPTIRGYTRTRHHAGHLTPGDWWRPEPGQDPAHRDRRPPTQGPDQDH